MATPVPTAAPGPHPNPRLARYSRWQAAAVHAALSAAIGAAFLVLMLLVWYPDELFRIAGGSTLIMILVGVDVVLGPLLTLIVFDAAKRWLKLDLALIAGVQLAALCYGAWVMYEARPAYLVFVIDRFEVISAIDVGPEARAAAARERFRGVHLGRPLLAAAAMPEDPKERAEVVVQAMNGIDVLLTPRYWIDYPEARPNVLARARTLDDIRRVDPEQNGPALDRAVAALGRPADGLRAVGIKAKHGEAVMLIDAETAEPLRMVRAAW